MTTLTTVFGALPVCLPTGSAAPLNKPLGLTLVAGLLASTVFTLICVPVAYKAAARRQLGTPAPDMPIPRTEL
jgi:multidrug efflux pump subunit AcrB